MKVYAYENMSFAVDKAGQVYCWGSNKGNIMNLRSQGLSKVDVPTTMVYPNIFGATPSLSIVQTQDSLALYSSKRLVKSQASET